MSSYWPQLLASLLWIAICLLTLPEGGVFWGAQVPAAGLYLILVFCIVCAAISIRGLLRGDGKAQKKKYTDEDAAKAKDELEKMYLKRHGRLPEYSEEIKNTFGPDMDDRTKDA